MSYESIKHLFMTSVFEDRAIEQGLRLRAALKAREDLLEKATEEDERDIIHKHLLTDEANVNGGFEVVRRSMSMGIIIDWQATEACPSALESRALQAAEGAVCMNEEALRFYAAAGIARANGDEISVDSLTEHGTRCFWEGQRLLRIAEHIVEFCDQVAASARMLEEACGAKDFKGIWGVKPDAREIWKHVETLVLGD